MHARDPGKTSETDQPEAPPKADDTPSEGQPKPTEIGGRGGLDPTRFGDWEKNGRCIDF